MDQIWAEAVTYYEAGETWYLDGAVEEMARKVQADHTEANGKLGLIENFLEVLLPEAGTIGTSKSGSCSGAAASARSVTVPYRERRSARLRSGRSFSRRPEELFADAGP